MGIGPVRAEVSCDECSMETEPVEIVATSLRMGFSAEAAIDELRNDGWSVDDAGSVICPDCQALASLTTKETDHG